MPHDLTEPVHKALRDWHQPPDDAPPLGALHLYRQALSQADTTRQATNRVLLAGIEQLAGEDPEAATLLEMRFADRHPVYAVANRLNIAEGTVYKKQRQAIERLAEILWAMDQAAGAGQRDRLLQRLEPPTYTHLFGAEPHIQTLRQRLLQPGPPWIVSVEALGGTGKTALVDALCRQMIEAGRAPDLAWVTARQSSFSLGGALQAVERPALTVEAFVDALAGQLLGHEPDYATLSLRERTERLRARLTAHPHLVVIDNLETHTDVHALLDMVRSLANHTKFLLTTRHSLFSEADVFHYALPELDETDALALVRHEARQRNLPELAEAADADLRPIFETVGGNPLALRLVVGQTHVHDLPTVLADLRAARSSAASGLYTHIYRRAWDNLDEEARRVLLIMPLVGEQGAPLEMLADIADLPPDGLRDGLARLVERNLVDARGGLHQRRYTIHSLTRSFLEEQVLQWGEMTG